MATHGLTEAADAAGEGSGNETLNWKLQSARSANSDFKGELSQEWMDLMRGTEVCMPLLAITEKLSKLQLPDT